MHEIIALGQRIAARDRMRPEPFSLARIDARRYLPLDKAPDKGHEFRPTRPVARRQAQRLEPVAERTGLVEKLRHRVARVGKLRLFRLWKLFGEYRVSEQAGQAALAGLAGPGGQLEALTRPLAERLAWLRRTRRL